MHALARRFEDRAHECDGRALAVGAGDMDHRRQLPLRMIERGQKPRHALEREIDALGMQRQQPRQHGVERRGMPAIRCAHAGAGAGRRAAAARSAGALVRSRQSLAIVVRRSWRCTTMSTMP